MFRSETITFLPPLINNALGEGFNVIGRVMLWRPVEAYVFNPILVRTSSSVPRHEQTLLRHRQHEGRRMRRQAL